MKTNTLFITAAAGLFCTAAALFSGSDAPAAPATAEARHKAKTSERAQPPAEAGDPRRSELASDAAEARNLAIWQERFATLEAEHGDREPALRDLFGQIDTAYRTWVSDELMPVAELPPAERYDELADIGNSVTEGVAAILEQLGIEENLHPSLVAGPLEALAAETQYAEAAKDSAARLALLRLDREREVRLEQALAIADETARGTAVAELDAWYDAGLGGIFTPAEP
jgi:hypothetical protein